MERPESKEPEGDFSPLDSRNISRDESDEGQYFSEDPIPRNVSSHSLFGEALLPGRDQQTERDESPWLLSPCQSARSTLICTDVRAAADAGFELTVDHPEELILRCV